MKRPRWHLAIFDPHVAPGQNLRRFDWLARMILEERPDVIVCSGDMATLDSCSEHEVGQALADQPTLKQDGEAVRDAQRRMFGPLDAWNARRLKARHPRYHPRRIMQKGNHEQRWDRWANKNPKQASAIDIDSYLGFAEHWDVVLPFKAYDEIDGVAYTHVPHTTMGKPLGGVSKVRRAALESSVPVFFGHGHDLQVATVGDLRGGPARGFAMSGPAFMDDGNVEKYAANNQTGWSYGLLRVRPQGPGRVPSYDYVSMRDLERLYG